MKRGEIAELMLARLEQERAAIERSHRETAGKIPYFVIDDLLPHELAQEIHKAFPETGAMRIRKSLREHKYVSSQMDRHNPLLEEAIYAFQDDQVVDFIKNICGMSSLYADESLYNSGISLMGKGQFLNPHLDNSHDMNRDRWRVMNLLYYVTPDWQPEYGGNLELWPEGVEGDQITIHSRFNRLVVMGTHEGSWHSVSPLTHDGARCCISNYYFSDSPLNEGDRFHVTSFRARPEQKIRDIVLQADIMLRMLIRKIFSRGLIKGYHFYKK